MRIVLDTNVVLAALLWRGPPYQLFKAIRASSLTQLCTSAFLIEELVDVLGRPVATRRLVALGRTAAAVRAEYLEITELIEPLEIPRVSRDPDDDNVLACAVGGGCEWIVSGDRDLLDLGTFRGIRILTARTALELLASSAI